MNKRKFQVIRALGGETRYKIVRKLIIDGPTSVEVIALALGMTHSAISHQLSILRRRNILSYEKQGLGIIYRVASKPEGKMAQAIMRV